MSESRRRCIFCESDNPLTSEHIWGDWVTDYVSRTANKHDFANIRVERPGEPDPAQARIRAGDPLSAQVRVVCGPCNSGWMSQLQQRAQPYLIPLFDGRDCVLDPKACTVLAE